MILTNYIDGERVQFKNEYADDEKKKWKYVYLKHYRLCEKTLEKLNSYGIQHRDARTSNFVMIYENNTIQAKILDFEFSIATNKKVIEYLKDDSSPSPITSSIDD